MNPRTVILAFVALSLAGATALFARHWLDSQRAVVAEAPVKKKAPPKEVLVAAKPLATGTFVKADELRWQPWPKNGIASSYAVKGKTAMSKFLGAVVRQDIAVGQPVTSAHVVEPGDRGFLAAVLKPGMRAVSVPITAETGISGLVFPGDHVDLILAQSFRPSNSKTAPMRRASETFLTNLRVLAIDQRTTDGKGKPKVGKTVTLEVTPKQAEDVAVAEELGKMSLSLRSLATEDPVVPPRGRGLTLDSQVSAVIRRTLGGSGHGSRHVEVLRGAKAEAVSVGHSGRSAHSGKPKGATPVAAVSTPMSDAVSTFNSGVVTVAKGSNAARPLEVLP